MRLQNSTCMLIIASLLFLNVIKSNATITNIITKRHPEDKCGGTKLYYTPLIRTSDEEELGVCDSSCWEINGSSFEMTDDENKKQVRHKKRLSNNQNDHKRRSILIKSNLYSCNQTKTYPEEDISEDDKNNFPFNMRTCFFDNSDKNHATRTQEQKSFIINQEIESQKTFERACKQAKGVFVRPFHKTW